MGETILLGDDYEQRLAWASEAEPLITAEAEDGHVILYTSGTTGNPKGALISHRAQLARMHSSCVDFDLEPAMYSWPGRRCSTWSRPISRSRCCASGVR